MNIMVVTTARLTSLFSPPSNSSRQQSILLTNLMCVRVFDNLAGFEFSIRALLCFVEIFLPQIVERCNSRVDLVLGLWCAASRLGRVRFYRRRQRQQPLPQPPTKE